MRLSVFARACVRVCVRACVCVCVCDWQTDRQTKVYPASSDDMDSEDKRIKDGTTQKLKSTSLWWDVWWFLRHQTSWNTFFFFIRHLQCSTEGTECCPKVRHVWSKNTWNPQIRFPPKANTRPRQELFFPHGLFLMHDGCITFCTSK